MKTRLVLLILCCFVSLHMAQGQSKESRLRTKGYVNPQEILSLDSTMRMDQALLVINELSKQFAGKVIIDLEKRKSPIGVYVVNQHWRDALDMILSHAGLTFSEEADFIRIMPQGGGLVADKGAGGQAPVEPPPTLGSRDVKISAVFFSTNLARLQNFGISWDFFRSKSKEPGLTGYMSAGIVRGDTLSNIPPQTSAPSLDRAFAVLKSPPEFTFANVNALVKFFGSNNLGEVITSPEIIVRNGRKGRIQIGKDIFISTRDIAGNAINSQVSTGTIIEVSPTIYTQMDTSFIYLDLKIEQSDAVAGQTQPDILRNVVTTHALLYDGEETVIGGIYTTKETETREGVPVLKDLPWWFFGLRYIFGSESVSKSKDELIMLIKAELTQPIRSRMATPLSEKEMIEKKRFENQTEYNKK